MAGQSSHKGGYILLGVGIALTAGLGITGAILYNQKQRQANFDYLISVIKADATDYTDANQKGSAFDKDAYKNTSCTIIDPVVASDDAAKLYQAIGTFTNDYDTIESVMRSLNSKCDLQQIADRFYNAYSGQDLLTYLKDGMTDDHLQTHVLNYTSKLT